MNKRNFLFSVLMLLVAVGSLNPAAAQEAEEAPEYVVPVPAGWNPPSGGQQCWVRDQSGNC